MVKVFQKGVDRASLTERRAQQATEFAQRFPIEATPSSIWTRHRWSIVILLIAATSLGVAAFLRIRS